MPFDPGRLTSSEGPNRVIIADLPGIALEASIKGKSAYVLLSTPALTDYLREQAAINPAASHEGSAPGKTDPLL